MSPGSRRHRRNFNIAGHAHELTFSCYRRLPLLSSDRTRTWLVDSINTARIDLQFDVWAWVFMSEHAHLLVRPRPAEYDIAKIRKATKEPVGRKAMRYLRQYRPDWLPKLGRRRGSRYEYSFWTSGGGYDRNITDAKALTSSLEYIHLNPVREGFVDRAEEWPWSSAAWFVLGANIPVPVDPIPAEWLA